MHSRLHKETLLRDLSLLTKAISRKRARDRTSRVFERTGETKQALMADTPHFLGVNAQQQQSRPRLGPPLEAQQHDDGGERVSARMACKSS